MSKKSKDPRNLKKKIRERMSATGEPWSVAKAAVLEQHHREQPPAHSEEWFEQMEEQDLIQATLTRFAIDTAGSPTCCSVCGDTDATEYRLDVELKGNLIRLCEDCVSIRRLMFGERFVRPGRARQGQSGGPPRPDSNPHPQTKEHLAECRDCGLAFARAELGEEIAEAIYRPFEHDEKVRRVGDLTVRKYEEEDTDDEVDDQDD